MTQLKPFTKDDIQKGVYRGEQLRRWHDYLKRAKEQDLKEVAREIRLIRVFKKKQGDTNEI